ncbi:hypothetical protein SARC_02476 [Sphaeroforma arctica JP610]|uniref:Uncharacterized protein n=1 Tax=Sphaeroforma arctica JP610 TaxID=667725 RepID=A0A0L0G8T8_9EUKA|nr:hypothetical protein SARC_02476 [Sphaeroforma arctica JP610]KNC85329.1 hypothetical protein SARC_02476 [Sphaeroforma arctica JP610]|eukprot:XP_014159231.1 hypothetical protein SARC_02476 [Sphaeroforma arctica JP610]
MMYHVGQQYNTYGNPLKNLVKRTSILRPFDHHTNIISIDCLDSEDCTINPLNSLSHTSIYNGTSQSQAELWRPSVNARGPEVDPKVLIDTLKFYPGYRGYSLAGNVKSKKAVEGYSVKIQRRTAILVSADEYGLIILSNDDASLQYRINWSLIADVDHVHTDDISTPLRKRKRTNYLALRLKDGSVYVINSLQTPELFRVKASK